MIAHRQNLVEYCDKVWSLESGTLNEKLNMLKKYKKMFLF